jgi:hypothetical protein
MAKGTRGPYKPRKKSGNQIGNGGTGNSGTDSGTSNADKSVAGTNAEGANNLASDTVDPAVINAGFTDPVAGPQTPEAVTEPSTGETVERRGPGRPRGTGNRAKISASGIEALLLGIHNTLYTVFGAEELKLQDAEARELANAYAGVAAEYPALNFDPKYAALANFAGVVSIVYGTRLASFKMRMAMKKPAQRQAPVMQHGPTNNAPSMTQPPVNQFAGPEIPTPEAPKGPLPAELRTAQIPGVGEIVFDPSHPLSGGKPN